MIVCKDFDEDGFKVHSSAGYFFLQTTMLFRNLNLDFKNNTIIFDLTREPDLDFEADGLVYKMNKRTNVKKKKEDGMK